MEVVEQILKPLRKSQRKTITLVVQAMASMAQAASIPIAAVFSKHHILRSQNTWENNFLRLLDLLLGQIQGSVCFLADRGFRRVSFLKLLMEQKGHSFVVRIGEQLSVETLKKKRLLTNGVSSPAMHWI